MSDLDDTNSKFFACFYLFMTTKLRKKRKKRKKKLFPNFIYEAEKLKGTLGDSTCVEAERVFV